MHSHSKHRSKGANSTIRRIRRLKRLEEFVEKQIDKYVRLHKRHEKELTYIG